MIVSEIFLAKPRFGGFGERFTALEGIFLFFVLSKHHSITERTTFRNLIEDIKYQY